MWRFLCNKCADIVYLNWWQVVRAVNPKTLISPSSFIGKCSVCELHRIQWRIYNDACGFLMEMCPDCCTATLQAEPYGSPFIDEVNWDAWYYCSMTYDKSNKKITNF